MAAPFGAGPMVCLLADGRLKAAFALYFSITAETAFCMMSRVLREKLPTNRRLFSAVLARVVR